MILVNTDKCCNSPGCTGIISRHHDDPFCTQFVKSADHSRRFFPDRVFDQDHSSQYAVKREVKMRIGVRKRFILTLFSGRNHSSLILKDEVITADQRLFPFNRTRDPMRDHVFDFRMTFFMQQAAVARFSDDRIGDRMRIVLLQTGSQTQHLCLVFAAERYHTGHFRLRIGHGTGLIKDNCVHIADDFHEPAALDRDALVTAFAHGRQHRDRKRQF